MLKLQTRHLGVLSDLTLELSELHQNEIHQGKLSRSRRVTVKEY